MLCKSYKNIPNWIDAFLAISFQQGATINQNRFNSVFYSLVNFVIQELVRLKHFYILGMSDAILPLYLKQGHWSHLNSIFSLLVTLAIQERERIRHLNIPDLSDAILTLTRIRRHHKINRNRWNSVFFSLFPLVVQVYVHLTTVFKYFQTESTLCLHSNFQQGATIK